MKASKLFVLLAITQMGVSAAPQVVEPSSFFNIDVRVLGCSGASPCIVRDATASGGYLYILLAAGNKPADRTVIVEVSLLGKTNRSVPLPTGFVYVALRLMPSTFVVSRISGRNAEVAQVSSDGRVLSTLSTSSLPAQLVAGGSLDETLWIADRDAKLTKSPHSQTSMNAALLSGSTLILPAGPSQALLIDQPTGVMSLVDTTSGTWRRQGLPKGASVRQQVKSIEARRAKLVSGVLGKSTRGSVFLVVSASNDQRGTTYLFLSPYSKTKGASVVALNKSGLLQNELLCSPPQKGHSTSFTPRFLLRLDNNLVLLSSKGQVAIYQLDL